MGSGVAPSQKLPGEKLIVFLKWDVNSWESALFKDNGGRDKNWTYDLYDVNVAFYHWTTHPNHKVTFPKNKLLY